MGLRTSKRWTARSVHLGECNKCRIHEMEKKLNSECREFGNLYMNEFTLRLLIYQNFVAFFCISTYQFTLSRIHGPVYSNCARTEKICQSAPKFQYY